MREADTVNDAWSGKVFLRRCACGLTLEWRRCENGGGRRPCQDCTVTRIWTTLAPIEHLQDCSLLRVHSCQHSGVRWAIIRPTAVHTAWVSKLGSCCAGNPTLPLGGRIEHTGYRMQQFRSSNLEYLHAPVRSYSSHLTSDLSRH